jgi:hypothetical protein
MTPSGSTYSDKYVGADITGLIVGGGPSASHADIRQAQSGNHILGAEIGTD